MRGLATLLGALALLAAGCGGSDEAGTDTGSPLTTEPATETRTVEAWFASGEMLEAVEVDVPVGAEPAGDALAALLAGPGDATLTTAIPDGTELNAVSVDDGVATVDLSRAFESGGGSLSVQLRVAQVVYTATGVEGVESVRIALDGELAEAIGGEGVIVDHPLTRDDFAQFAP